jgi:hypothetical protein
MAGRYAVDTDVSTYRSREEIERTLVRYGADRFTYGWDADKAVVGFRIRGRQVRLEVTMPPKSEFRFTPSRGLERDPAAIEAAWEQACRQRWRALSLVIKAKLEAVDAGITTLDEEFLAHVVLRGGLRVIDELGPRLLEAAAQPID